MTLHHDNQHRQPPTIAACRWFPGNPTEIPKARHFVADRLGNCPCAEDAVLVISELATNAVRHTTSAGWRQGFIVSIEHRPQDWSRITVHDLGSPSEPRSSVPAPDAEHGRGLHLVEAIAENWGHNLTLNAGHDTWAEFKCG